MAFFIPRECYLYMFFYDGEGLGFLKELESGFAVDFLGNAMGGVFFDGFAKCGWITNSEIYAGIRECCFECEPDDLCVQSAVVWSVRWMLWVLE